MTPCRVTDLFHTPDKTGFVPVPVGELLLPAPAAKALQFQSVPGAPCGGSFPVNSPAGGAAAQFGRERGAGGGESGPGGMCGCYTTRTPQETGRTSSGRCLSSRDPLASSACRCLRWMTSLTGFTQGSSLTLQKIALSFFVNSR